MMRRNDAAAVLMACMLLECGAAAAQTAAQTAKQEQGHVTGIGGIFVTSPHPAALAAWYRDTLGIHIEPWGGAMLRYDAPGHPPMAIWSAFPANPSEFVPSERDVMINFAVDNLDAFVERLHRKGVPVLNRDDSDPSGRFAWILDPDGTKIELWQPKPK